MAKPIGADKKRSTANLPLALGAELTDRRTNRGWTQQQLADKLGYDISYIGQVERGEKSPTFRTMMSLAEVFEIKVSQLVSAAEKRVKRT